MWSDWNPQVARPSKVARGLGSGQLLRWWLPIYMFGWVLPFRRRWQAQRCWTVCGSLLGVAGGGVCVCVCVCMSESTCVRWIQLTDLKLLANRWQRISNCSTGELKNGDPLPKLLAGAGHVVVMCVCLLSGAREGTGDWGETSLLNMGDNSKGYDTTGVCQPV